VVLDVLFELIRWEGGDFAFTADEAPLDDVGLRLEPAPIVAEAAARLADWEAATAAVPGPDRVPRLVRPTTDEIVVPAADWALLTLADGRRTVADVVALSGLGAFTVVTRLASLVDRGLLEAAGGAGDLDAWSERSAVLAMLDTAEGLTDELGAVSEPPSSSDASDAPSGGTVVTVAMTEPSSSSPSSSPSSPSSGRAPTSSPGAVAVAPTSTASARSRNEPIGPVLLGGAHIPRDVVPARPDPTTGGRRPEHPEPGAGLEIVGANAIVAAVDPDPLTQGDDPDSADGGPTTVPVNRSMVLRLIAGVRGL
jgi:hypothetical protein